MNYLKIIFVLLLFYFSLSVNGQGKINPKDSVCIKDQIEGFYSWYLKMIREDRLNHDFNPKFVKQKNGMTELDFNSYEDGLRKYKFTENFIQRKISEYKKCNENLNKISFEEFSKFEDLDEYERISCDFSNRYEWIGGMEPKESARLSSLTFMDFQTIIGTIDFFSYSRSDGNATVTFKKFGKEWYIENFELTR